MSLEEKLHLNLSKYSFIINLLLETGALLYAELCAYPYWILWFASIWFEKIDNK